jgi:hypothetical protein
LNVLEDAEGKFARESRLRLPGSSPGMSYVTASGKLLGVGFQQRAMEDALKAWNALPEAERKPGAFQVPERGPIDSKRATVQPPSGSLILKLHSRYLAREPEGELRLTTLLQDFPGIKDPATRYPRHFDYYCEANADFMWLTEAEWKSLIPVKPTKGETFSFPAAIADRLCQYHLLPGSMHSRTGYIWDQLGLKDKGIRAREMTLTVEEVTASSLRLTLTGFVHLGHPYDSVATAKVPPKRLVNLGYEAQIRGVLEYDSKKQVFTRFDMLVLGDLYGDSDPNRWLVRSGRNPLGFAFELVRGDTPGERLPPRGYLTKTDLERYLGK